MPFEVPQQDPCPFCENVAGRIVTSWDGTVVPCAEIESLGHSFSFLSPRQIGKPHILVIPKRHAKSVLDLMPEEMAAIAQQVQRLAAAVVKTFEPSGLNIFQNNGIGAGQSVGHYHVHVVARYGDGSDPQVLFSRDLPRTPFEELQQLVERIRSAL